MTFWIIAVLLALLSSAIVVLALLRGRVGDEPPAAYDLRVYRDQLKEVDRDLARGVIGAGDAERIRTEVSRRILAADAQLQQGGDSGGQPKRAGQMVAALTTVALITGSLALYFTIGSPGYGDQPLGDRIATAQERHDSRPSQQEFVADLPPQPANEAEGQYAELIAKLRDTVAQKPDDLQGQTLLARNEAGLGNFGAAAVAQAKVIELSGADADTRDYTIYADILINEAQGYVSPEAEAALTQAIKLDGDNLLARYYWGLMLMQNDRPDLSFEVWEEVLRRSTPDAPWVPVIRDRIEELAWLAGVDYKLPPAHPAMPAPGLPGPSAEDVENAAEMNAEDRQAMIRSMVEQLNDRLATEGGTPAEWARLISVLGVLGETDRARAIWQEAQTVFAGKAEALDEITAAARSAGIAE